MARATNSCTPHGGSQGGRRESSLLTFGTFGHSKVQEKKSIFKIKDKSPSPVNSQNKRYVFYPLFLLPSPPQKKKLQKKENAGMRFRALRSATRTTRAPVSATPTHMLRICVNPPVSATPTHMLRICVNPPTAPPFPKGGRKL